MGFFYAVLYAIIILRFSLGGHMKKTFFVLMMMTFVIFLSACNKESIKEPLNFNLIAVKDGKYGVINQDGEEVLPFTYGKLSNVSNDGVMIHQYGNQLFELINIQGEVIHTNIRELEPLYDRSFKNSTHATPYAFKGIKDYYMTIFDSHGQVFMKETESVYVYHQKLYSEHGRFELNDVSKELVNQYQKVYQTSDNTYFTFINHRAYLLDAQGNIIKEHEQAVLHPGEYIVTIYDMNGGFIYDNEGHLLYENVELEAIDIVEDTNYIIIEESGLFGLLNIEGERILDSQFLDIQIKNNLIVAQSFTGGFDLYHDSTLLNHVNNFNFQHNFGYANNVYLFYNVLDGKYYYYEGNQIVAGPYDLAYPFNEMGITRITEESGAMVLVNTDFEVVNQTYPFYYPFGNYFLVRSHMEGQENTYGFIDSDMNIVVPIENQIEDIYSIFNDFIYMQVVGEDYLEFYIINQNKNLQRILDLSLEELMKYEYIFDVYYDHMNPVVPTYYGLFYNNFLSYFNSHMNEGYQVVDFVHHDFLIATYEGKYGVLNSKHEVVIPFEYDWIIANSYEYF
jgi:hypothetical protein